MSSYSEYLGRMKQRMVTITDTRPHRDAGHQTEIIKRLAASGNLETRVASTACAVVLNAPSTATASGFLHGGGHTVQDTTVYSEYVAGQALAQATRVNTKASQITNTMPCLSSSQLPEINDKLAADAQLSLIQAARQNYGNGYANNCCPNCKKVLLADSCNCRLTVTQQAALKSTINWPHTADRNA
jgi:primosomal protein N'